MMYFGEPLVKRLLRDVAEQFSDTKMFLEVLAPFAMRRRLFHDSPSRMETPSESKWRPKYSRVFETWHPGISLKEEWFYFRYYRRRWGLFGILARLLFIESRLSSQIVYVCFAQ
ncbi:MAG: hypothetical protein KAR40_03960 [Candidatus Sabulitectum sp.]|nr:hypothetical protein [Candidatus Sabulitectum sp.]